MPKTCKSCKLEFSNVQYDKHICSKKLKTLDLFCGCGGLSKGLEEAGFDIVAGIDHWDRAIQSYSNNFDHLALCKDLTKFPPEKFAKYYDGDIDVIVGGPPCQGFSIAGKRDKNDPRNSLFMEYVKYLTYYKPKIFMLENVMGILSMKTNDGEKAIDVIMGYLEQEYDCIINKLYAHNFEVPQKRRRVVIIGIRKDLNILPTSPDLVLTDDECIPVSTILLDREDVDLKYFLSEKAISGILKKKAVMKEKSYGFGAQFLKLDKPSYTIPARYWKDGYDALVKYDDKNIRRLTELELKRIQSFPDDYILEGNKKEVIMQIGNAVAVNFAYHMGIHLTYLLNKRPA